MTRALCRTTPPEYFYTGDDGNRLALMLCEACPARTDVTCSAGLPDPRPHGVIRAGIAYSEAGYPLGICDCGYPFVTGHGGPNTLCHRCDPPLAWFRLTITYWAEDKGYGAKRIARQLGYHPTSVRQAMAKWGITRNDIPTERTAA